MIAEPFPFDVAALKVGDVIDVVRLEAITQTVFGTTAYHYAVRKLIERVNRERRQAGRPLVLRQRKGAVEVCDAPQGLHVARNRAAEASRKLRKTQERLLSIAVTELSPAELLAWEALAQKTAARLIAFSRRAPKRIVAPPVDDLAAAKLLMRGRK